MIETPSDALVHLKQQVVEAGICTSCGACASLDASGLVQMRMDHRGLHPRLEGADLVPLAWEACPGKGIDYPGLYRAHFGRLPEDWRIGICDKMWIGHSADPAIRKSGASGGVTTAVLIHLLESGKIDGAILARQGVPTPEAAGWFIARTRQEVLDCAQSVYIPVPMLESLRHLQTGERYAITCTPDQSAALRVLQQAGHPPARQIEWVLGPYTGTALRPAAIRALLRSKGIPDADAIISLKWRAGEWPGYLEVRMASGRVVQSKKVYYNFLIPFYVTQASLQSIDFANEFTDLSVGDAWSPKYEALGQGFSVVCSRTPSMTLLLMEMAAAGLLTLEAVDPLEASAMHGHMIDFKKRGSSIRNRFRRRLGLAAPDDGLTPHPVGPDRIVAELVVSSIFVAAGTPVARQILEWIPESVIGPLFNRLRLTWKALSKPTKRKGLKDLTMECHTPAWKRS